MWDCDAMYPTPKKTTIDPWEMVSGVAKEGFKLFKAVKDLIPAGAMAGIDKKIPGFSAAM